VLLRFPKCITQGRSPEKTSGSFRSLTAAVLIHNLTSPSTDFI
jgi:hypothetical protein